MVLCIATALLAGCPTINVVPKYQGGTVEVVDGKAPIEAVEAKAIESCKARSMNFLRLENFDEGKLFNNTILGAYLYRFYCDPSSLKKEESTVESTKARTITPALKMNEGPKTQKLSLEEAQTQCSEIGFKPKTEKYAKCVMELSK